MTTKHDSLIDTAIATMSVIHDEMQRYREANRVLRSLDSDFPVTAKAASDAIFTSVGKLLDEILGDEIASYFLFEVPCMEGRGMIITPDEREWPIRSPDDVRAYVLREKSP
jgi:hypothetical protein